MQEFLKNKKFIFFVYETIPYNSGSGRNAFYFARFLSEKGFRSKLISLNRNLHLPFRTIANKLIISRIPYFNRNKLFKWLSLFIILPFYLYEILKTNIILIYGPMPAYEFIILCGKLFRKKIIFQSLLFGEDDIKSLLIKKPAILKSFYKRIFNGIDIYFSINPEFSKSFLSIFSVENRLFSSPQGVDTGMFHPVSPEQKNKLRNNLSLPKEMFIILSIGLLIKRKGFNGIFECLSGLNIPFLYVIVGDYNLSENHFFHHSNKEMKELYSKGKKLMGEKIRFTGPVENTNEYLQAADLFLLNSEQEGLPNALLEAMACKLPAVVKNIPGIYTFVCSQNENALMFDHEGEMADCIRKIFYHPEIKEALGNNAYEFIKKHGSFQQIAKKLMEMLFIKESGI